MMLAGRCFYCCFFLYCFVGSMAERSTNDRAFIVFLASSPISNLSTESDSGTGRLIVGKENRGIMKHKNEFDIKQFYVRYGGS